MEPKHVNKLYSCFARTIVSLVGAGIISFALYYIAMFFAGLYIEDQSSLTDFQVFGFIGAVILYGFLFIVLLFLSKLFLYRKR